jgi:RHS repeat-associated protein
MKAFSPTRLTNEITSVSATRNQANALVLLIALMMPVAAPVPGWAYDLNLPPAPATAEITEHRASLIDSFTNSSRALLAEVRGSLTSAFGSSVSDEVKVPKDESRGRTTRASSGPPEASPKKEDADEPVSEILPDTDEAATASDNGAEVNEELNVAAEPAPLVQATDQEVRDSAYEPDNNVGAPPNQTEIDSPNTAVATRIRHRAGTANYTFAVPFASLPGRGINASVGMTYNSRVWNKTSDGTSSHYQFDVDAQWLAPGFSVGYGKLKSRYWNRWVRPAPYGMLKTFNEVVPEGYTDPDGTRHQLECKAWEPIPGTTSQYGENNDQCIEYGTTDGTLVKVLYHGSRTLTSWDAPDTSVYASTYFTLIHTDGTKVTYSYPGAQFGATDTAREHYPVRIQDRNGNSIDVGYKNGKDNIELIRDTLHREIRFHYDSVDEKKLVAVTVPGFNGGIERQTIRFYYENAVALNYQGKFSGTAFGPATYRALKYIYFPATQSGYRYDYHPNFGMIKKISKLTGMTVSGGGSLTSTGTVDSEGTTAATTEYTFPNDGSQTPLTDVPKFTQRADDWLGRTASTPTITYYDAPEPGTDPERVSRVTVDDIDFDVEYETVAYNTTDWKNGLPKETTITKVQGSGQFRFPMAKTVYSWDQGDADASGRRYPILISAEVTNDAGQVRVTSFEYDTFYNQKKVIEHDFAAAGQVGAELRRTETTYETGSAWISNRLLRLPKEVKTTVNNTTASKVVYEYDNYSEYPLADTPGVIHYLDPGTNFRGNVTKVTAFSDATNASVNSLAYDKTGNVVRQSGVSCCNVRTTEYSAANYFAYPTKVIKGSTITETTETAFDYNTGLPTSTKDENNHTTSFTYDPDTLRQTRADYPNGAWTSAEYNDTAYPYHVKTTSSLDAARSISSWSFMNGAGQTFRSRSLTANGYLSSDVEFDGLGRATKTFNPYTVTSLNDSRPAGIKFTEITQIDALGRTLQTKLPDDTTVSTAFNSSADTPALFNRTFVTITDQAGKKRRQLIDALGRIVRVDEPGTNGDLGPVGTPVQPTEYEFDGNDNLTKVTQSIPGAETQIREFKYDSLSRLTHERQVEATPTLDIDGVKGSADPTKWTGYYKYTPDGLLDFGVDARGVKTDLSYDGLNRVEAVEYFGEVGYTTPKVVYTYSEARNDAGGQPYQNNGRLTTIETLENTAQGTPKTIQRYDYDPVGQVKRHKQTIGTNEYELEYGYNLTGQLVSEKYPSGRVVNMTVDNFGVVQTIADSQRTYMNGVTFNYAANGMTSQMTLGNGTTETFTTNERFQLTSQSLMRGSEVLQKYNYNYGDLDSSGVLKNNGKLEQVESFIGSNKQWTQNFRYDSIGRLKQTEERRGDTNALSYRQVFDFDRFGNLYRKAGSNSTTGQQNPLPFTPIEESTTPGTGDIDRATNRFRTDTTYNEAGQVMQDNKFREMGFVYDANGRVVKGTKPNTPDARTVYDALGNRVATKINDVWQYMIYDAFGQLIAEYGVPSDGMGGVEYIQQDHQGSVRTIMNSNGFVVSRTDHQAFGETIGSGVGLRNVNQGYGVDTSTRLGYGLTENDDASGQQHTWFRKLETPAGRWSSPDPYKGSMNLSDPQSFSRYAYVNNEPTNYVDPSGLAVPVCQLSGGQIHCSSPSNYSGADVGYSGGGILITTSIIQPHVEAKPDLVFRSYEFIPFFSGYFGGLSNWDAKARRAADIAIAALQNKPDCKKLFSIFGHPSPSNHALPGNGSPESALGVIRDRKQIRYHPIENNIGHAVLAGSPYNANGAYPVRETILVNSGFFNNSTVGGSITFSQASAAQIASLSPDQARALILLHELLHHYYNRGHESAEPGMQDGALNDHLLWNCF